MGMREYSLSNYGLVIDEETSNYMASVFFDDYDEGLEYNWQIELCGSGVGVFISEFTGNIFSIKDDGSCENFTTEGFTADQIFYIPIVKYPTLFSAAYKNMEELIKEFKNRVGKYLPDDFDYKNNIRYICGTYYA